MRSLNLLKTLMCLTVISAQAIQIANNQPEAKKVPGCKILQQNWHHSTSISNPDRMRAAPPMSARDVKGSKIYLYKMVKDPMCMPLVAAGDMHPSRRKVKLSLLPWSPKPADL
jgi:hypothetical protein